jgi:vancomycin resistance protein YoaR
MAAAVNAPAREASIELQGLQPRIRDSKTGSRLDRPAASRIVVAALTGFAREPVPLPIEVDEPAVTRATLAPVAAQVRTALSAPVRLTYRSGGWTIRPHELAPLLDLPDGGVSELRIGGPAAERYFENLARGVRRTAVSADFAVAESGEVRVVRARRGRKLDVAATEAGILKAAVRQQGRATPLAVASVAPPLTTAEARGLRIERRLASYATLYAGTADRIANLQRAVLLLDGARIAPGATFSFNRRVGPRTEARGFRLAPVIMNGKYEEGIGGGVSQVATTLFNVAWEAGLPITDRTAHALYISRYPAGRDATVNYPDVDLQFRNDTGRWIVLTASYDESGIAISLLGGGAVRRVESVSGPLEETGDPPVERTPDPTLYVGERVVVSDGEPARDIRVTRTVYEGGKAVSEETWYTAYRAEPKEVLVGTKPRPVEPAPPPPPKDEEKKGEPAPPGGDGEA